MVADDTTDISQIEQFSLCVSYFECEKKVLREDFRSFIPVYDLSGAGLAKVIQESLVKFGLNLQDMRGQGGAATMRGEFRGVQAHIKEQNPLALYSHCAAHTLNLCLVDASKVNPIRNCMRTISDICAFFHSSAKRTNILKEEITNLLPESKRLISLCEARWVQRHDAVLMFKSSLVPII